MDEDVCPTCGHPYDSWAFEDHHEGDELVGRVVSVCTPCLLKLPRWTPAEYRRLHPEKFPEG